MLYRGHFYNIDNDKIIVSISTTANTNATSVRTSNSGSITELVFNDDPVIINLNSDESLFSPIKPLSCTITLVVHTQYQDMYQNKAYDNTVEVYNDTTKTVLFYGYITPNEYSQPWINVDELEIECISPLSVLKYIDYGKYNRNTISIKSWSTIIGKIFNTDTKHYTEYYWSNIYGCHNGTIDDYFLKTTYINEMNFFDDDDEHTPWKSWDVLEEFCKFMNVSLVEYNDMIYFIDYTMINAGHSNVFRKYNSSTDTVASSDTVFTDERIINTSMYKSTGGSISYDDTFTKITVKDNLYEIDRLFPSPWESKVSCHPNVNYLTFNWKNDSGKDKTSLLRLYYSGDYEHKFYTVNRTYVSDSTGGISAYSIDRENPGGINTTVQVDYDIADYTNEDGSIDWERLFTDHPLNLGNIMLGAPLWNSTSEDDIKQSLATFFSSYASCLLCEYMTYDKADPPSKYDWNQGYIFCYGVSDTKVRSIEALSKPFIAQLKNSDVNLSFAETALPMMVLKNNYSNNLVIGKKDKKTYLLINSESSFHCTNVSYGSTGGKNFFLNFDDSFCVIDNLLYNGEPTIDSKFNTLTKLANNGGPSIKLSFTNGSSRFIWAPLKVDNETKLINNTLKIRNTVLYNSGIDGSGYSEDVSSLFAGGDLNVQWLLPPMITIGENVMNISGNRVSFCILTDPEIKFVSPSYKLINDLKIEDDIIFTGPIDAEFVNEFSDIELKINTQQDDRAFSYSSVIYKENYANYYVENMYDDVLKTDQMQELNIIQKQHNHFSTPKIIYEVELKADVKPWTVLKETNFNKRMLVNSWEYNIRNNSMSLNLIEY